MSDDPTERVPTTKPGIEAVLERINALEAKLSGQITQAVADLRAEMQTGFRKLEHKIELQARNIADLYADERGLESRVGRLEEKAS